ncbi:MAG TPA: tetratricopeptide repeat protein [Casimicrobiaceae bacterium]|nr:tetratricopeptide repeat protein [Casimicrobiaceae bacterium]
MKLLKELLAGARGHENRRPRIDNANASSSAKSVGVLLDVREVLAQADSLNAQGFHAKALDRIDRALGDRPDDTDLLIARGTTLYEWGRAREAVEALQRAAELGATDANLSYKLGWASFVVGRVQEAVTWMQKAFQAKPVPKTRFGLAIALETAGRKDEAGRHFKDALDEDDRDYECAAQYGLLLMSLPDLPAAERLFWRAIEIRPENAIGWTNLGVALSRQRRSREALSAFERADRIEIATGQSADNFINLAVELADNGRIDEAIALYERHLPANPLPAGHFAYAGVLIRSGRMRDGWCHYEYRWLQEPFRSARERHQKPVWGGQNLEGHTILLQAEQGSGDTIQFVRYAAMLKALGATVLLRVPEGLARLGRRLRGIDRVIPLGEPLPPFDYYVHLLSLPRVFGTDVATIPAATPYIESDPKLTARWAERLRGTSGWKVGLVWAGNPNHPRDSDRSIPPEMLALLTRQAGVQFVSLQKGDAGAQAADSAFGETLADFTDELSDFDDTAALIDALDFVIGVDTAVLHLAGALGKETWALLPTPPDFRWMGVGDTSPWYPTMRLFRQHRQGDWNDVIRRVATALQDAISQKRDNAAVFRSEPSFAPVAVNRELDVPAAACGGVRPDMFLVAETRHGLLQYRPHDDPVGKSLHWYGEYLEAAVNLLARLVRPDMAVVEANAGIGAHAVFLASLLGPKGHLMLYEDDALLRNVLRRNLDTAGAENVTVMQRSIGNETLDELRLARLGLVKVNAASANVDVLTGAEAVLWKLRPTLFLEMADRASGETMIERLEGYGYACRNMTLGLHNPANFYRRDTDIFEGKCAYAVLAFPEERAGNT